MENYLQRAWSDVQENVAIEDIKDAIAEIQEMDDEHGVFWLSIGDDEENILEIDKEMKMIAIFSDDPEHPISKKFNTWEHALCAFEILLKGDLESLRIEMEK